MMKVTDSSKSTKSANDLAWSDRRHLLDTKDLTLNEIAYLFAKAKKYRDGGPEACPLPPQYLGKAVANVFYENSTRTRSSFEIAGKMLKLNVVNLDAKVSSVNKGESIEDTGRALAAMGFQIIVQRHSSAGSAHLLAQVLGDKVHVVNAGDGANGHPTQGLLDLFTMQEFVPSLKGRKVVIVGDIAHSRVARANLWLLNLMGAETHFVGPPTLMPSYLDKLGGQVHLRLEDALPDADFIIVLRLQLERQQSGLIPSLEEYERVYRIDHERLKLAKPDVKVMHPGPMNRDIEITNALADDQAFSLMQKQIANGFYIRMAVLHTLMTMAN